MRAFFTHAHTYKYCNVSKPAQLKVNTPVPCTSLIRQFGEGRGKSFPFQELTSTWEKGISNFESKYICHNVKGKGLGSNWQKKRRTSESAVWLVCVNSGFFSTSAAVHMNAILLPSLNHKCLYFQLTVSHIFIFFYVFIIKLLTPAALATAVIAFFKDVLNICERLCPF